MPNSELSAGRISAMDVNALHVVRRRLVAPELDIAMASSTAHNLRVSIFLSPPYFRMQRLQLSFISLDFFLLNAHIPCSDGLSGCFKNNLVAGSNPRCVGAYIAGQKCYTLWFHTCNSVQAGLLQGSWDGPRSQEQGDHTPKTVFLCILSMRASATLVVLKGLNGALI